VAENQAAAPLCWHSARRLTLNTNVFAARFAGYQLDGVSPTDVIFLNAQRVGRRGVAVEATWKPVRAATLFAQLGLLRARIDRFDFGDCAQPAPPRTVGVSARVDFGTVDQP
jgi:outer membrane receptor protein involved in Fe transport